MLSLALTLLSCQKQDTALPCDTGNFGGYCFENTTLAQIEVYVNGRFQFTLGAGDRQCLTELSAGYHKLRACQPATGKEWVGSLEVIQCRLQDRVFER